eukprot:gnl/TRDRNA2_/TRDRNA2_191662_c0_seq1.p1 gnl/TRDRNA2_/TRDRNA2_191662_c0~~gnl/TRDRNA2_/TRDRNA2_191662_c0_seq1.p1  ORF type:complete len:288 (+),score=28.09 gnl/TRDRNA2_/TRDRNA2_191662_c0_seq1:124-987(+)
MSTATVFPPRCDPYAYCTAIVGRLGMSGLFVSVATIDRTVPQIVATSNNRLTSIVGTARLGLFKSVLPKQCALKTAQFAALREVKLPLQDLTGSPAASSMLAYGITGVPFQSVLYNMLIADTYKYKGLGSPASGGISAIIKSTILPGMLWCFIRECCATGGGLYFGPMINERLAKSSLGRDILKVDENPVTKFAARFGSGLVAGAGCALATQWLHNTCLTAGRLAALGETVEAPHYTRISIQRAWQELGPRMFYTNFPQRMVVIAVASATLNLADIFHRPDVRLVTV